MSDIDYSVLGNLGQDHKELRQTMTELSNVIVRVDGKVDTAIALLERSQDRQDRSETRMEKLEARMDSEREKAREEIRAVDERHAKSYNRLSKYVWLAIGMVMLLAFATPVAVNIIY